MPQVPMLHTNAVVANAQSGSSSPISGGGLGVATGPSDEVPGHDPRADGGFHTALDGVKKRSDEVKKPGDESKNQNDSQNTGAAPAAAGSLHTHSDTKTDPNTLAGGLSGAAAGQNPTDHGKFQPPFLPWTLPVEARAGHIVLAAGTGSVRTALMALGQNRLPPSLAARLRHPGAAPDAALGTGTTVVAGKAGDFLQRLFPALHKQDPPGTAFDQTLLARLAVDPATTKALLGGGASPAQLMLAGAGPAVPHLPGATVTPAGLIIPQPVQHPGWSQALGERVQWMLGQNMQSAHIRLNPPGLGPLEVRILIQGDQTSVQFITHHTQAHDALEASLPRLRDMLGNQGMQLGNLNVNVSAHPFSGYTPSHGGAGQGGYGGGAPAGLNADDSASVLAGAVGLRQRGLSMLDVYA